MEAYRQRCEREEEERRVEWAASAEGMAANHAATVRYQNYFNHRPKLTPDQSYEEYLEADRQFCTREEAARRVV